VGFGWWTQSALSVIWTWSVISGLILQCANSSIGVDNAIEFKIVTSTGDYLTVNSHRHPDLFWALRGGGGGTYGVVTEVTYRTHPSVPLTALYFGANSTNNDTFKTLFTEFVRIHPNLSDAGFAGYATVSSNSIQVFYMGLNMTQTQANITIEPFFAFAQNLTSEGLSINALTVPYPSFYAWYTSTSSTGQPAGMSGELASRLVSRDTFERNPKDIADAVLPLNDTSWMYVFEESLNSSAYT